MLAPEPMATRWCLGDLEIHSTPPELLRSGQPLAIDLSSLQILVTLAEAGGEPVAKDRLLQAGWPGRVVHENSLAKAIGRLRSILEPDAIHIRVVHGFGYKLVAHNLQRIPTPSTGHAFHVKPPSQPARKSGLRMLAVTLAIVSLVCLGIGLSYWQKPIENTQAEALLQFLADDLLNSADPYTPFANPQKQTALRSLVEQILPGMDSRFADEPEVLMSLHHAIARAYGRWGEYQKALAHTHQSKQLAEELSLPREIIALEASLCSLYRLAEQTSAAEHACNLAVNHAVNANAPGMLAVRLERAKLWYGVDKFQTAVDELMLVLVSAGPATDLRLIADAQWFLGLTLRKLSRFNDADAAFKALLESRHQLDQARHPLMARAYTDYGDFLVQLGQFEQADILLRRAQAVFDSALGPEQVESVAPAYSLGVLYNETQQWSAAIGSLEPALAVYRKNPGADHIQMIHALNELALAEAGAGNRQRARQLLSQAQAMALQELDENSAQLAQIQLRWAQTQYLLQDYEDAETALASARNSLNAAYLQHHPLHARAYCLAARVALAQGDRLGARLMTNNCAAQMGALNVPASFPLHAQLALLNQSLAGG